MNFIHFTLVIHNLDTSLGVTDVAIYNKQLVDNELDMISNDDDDSVVLAVSEFKSIIDAFLVVANPSSIKLVNTAMVVDMSDIADSVVLPVSKFKVSIIEIFPVVANSSFINLVNTNGRRAVVVEQIIISVAVASSNSSKYIVNTVEYTPCKNC